MSKSSFNRVTRFDLHFHPFRMHVRHEILPEDLQRRQQFSQWFLERCNRNHRFLRYFLIGDEAGFAMNGKVNTHNVLEYAPVGQPPDFNFDRISSRQKVTVWIGIVGNGVLIGPVFFDANVDGQAYLQMIQQHVIPGLEMHFQRQENRPFPFIWWAQDGAPAHRLIVVRNLLRELFGNRVVALNHPVEWPPRSPDLTPCDFFCGVILRTECIPHLHKTGKNYRIEFDEKLMFSETIPMSSGKQCMT